MFVTSLYVNKIDLFEAHGVSIDASNPYVLFHV
jgi:hypothetical protein